MMEENRIAIEYTDKSRENRSVMESLEWARREAKTESLLEKDGFHTLYNVQEHTGKQTRTIKILEKEGINILMVGGKAMYSNRSLDKCVEFAKKSGYINKRENIKPHKETRMKTKQTGTTITKPAAPAAQKITTKKPATKQQTKPDNSWGVCSIHSGWIG